MLVVSYIQENKDRVIEGLKKRNFKQLDLVDEVLNVDELRRKTQFELDNVLAESNKLAKEIGNLFKDGRSEEANELKNKTVDLKTQSKELQDLLSSYETSVKDILYQIPNIPNEIVKAGKDADDNEIVFEHGDATAKPNNLPHWE
ncbi:MAG TPA: serine--tRNA ligase, partial [Flavobacteriaceae bacterium]|nr:serine--tRNA ligase [Flavobacteriaceae bacterium]